MRLEPQRLLAHGPSTLPADVVVDCGSVLRAVAGDAASPVWAQLADVSRASGRSFLWVVAPTPTPDPNVQGASLGALAQALAGLCCASILRSDEPLVGLLRAAPVALRDLVVVTAEVEDHVHELVVLGMGVNAVLDVATGRLWDRAAVDTTTASNRRRRPQVPVVAHSLSSTNLGRASRKRGQLKPASQVQIPRHVHAHLVLAGVGHR